MTEGKYNWKEAKVTLLGREISPIKPFVYSSNAKESYKEYFINNLSYDEIEAEFNRIFSQLTEEENNELFLLSVNGIIDTQNKNVTMRYDQYKMIIEFKKKMIKKYYPFS